MKETPPELASLLAHELEAPLLTIELHLRKLLDDRVCRGRVESCLDEVRALRSLVSEFMATAKGDFVREPFALQPVVERIEARFRPVADACRIRLAFEKTNLNAIGDEQATERVLSNLVDNSIKFSHPECSVRMRAHASEGRVAIEVADDGPGLDTKDSTRIFEPFFRARRGDRGYGLGLAVARQCAEGQGGTLTLERRGEPGALFVLRLESC